jgi:hypothetical protein
MSKVVVTAFVAEAALFGELRRELFHLYAAGQLRRALAQRALDAPIGNEPGQSDEPADRLCYP